MTFEEVVSFHGHACPGLAIGYRMTQAAMAYLTDQRAEDEELVAIVENDACGVDAVQYISGCTFGKGNLIFRDYGKQVYTFYCRGSGKAVRVVHKRSESEPAFGDSWHERVEWLLKAPIDEVLELREVHIQEPERARIRDSVECAFCGERVMSTRVRQVGAQPACIPCAEEHSSA